MLKQICQRVTHFAVPTTCVACGAVLPVGEPLGVCSNCWPTLPFWRPETEPMPALPPQIDGFAAPFLYENPVRTWITRTKFADRTELAPVLAEFMLGQLPIGEDILLVPVPLHPKRLRWRLFNQSALLAQTLSRRSGLPWRFDALSRVRPTVPQVKKTRRQRRQLPASVFAADAAQVQGKTIVLIDDIWTTGSTARACATALRKAGARRVEVRTVAYVAP